MLHEDYEYLYARYLSQKRTDQLVELCGDLQGRKVLDLCGGGGRASIGALAAGAASATVVDKSPGMSGHLANTEVKLSLMEVDIAISTPGFFDDAPYDAIICQQGVNYWYQPRHAEMLHLLLQPGGRFVFNTFNECPKDMPTPKCYELGGRRFIELSWLVGDLVEHVQICEGRAPHTTRFRWIPPEQFHSSLQPYFDVHEIREGKTSVYRCIAKDIPRKAR